MNKNLHLLLTLLLVAVCGSAFAQSYKITFSSKANGTTQISSTTKATTVVTEGSATYLMAQPFTKITKSYYGGPSDQDKASIRVGAYNAGGDLTIKLSESGKVYATSIVVNAQRYNADKTTTLSVNGKADQDIQAAAADYTYELNGKLLDSLTFKSSIAVYVNSITVNFEATETPDFVIDENANAVKDTAGVANVVLKRTFFDNAWSTLILPFDMNASQVSETFGSDVKIANLVGTTVNADGTLTLKLESATTISANVPVMIYGTNNAGTYNIDRVTLVNHKNIEEVIHDGVKFGGFYYKNAIPTSISTHAPLWFIASDNKFYKIQGGETFKATRCAFLPETTATASAKAINFMLDGEMIAEDAQTTAIENVEFNSNDNNSVVYNLAGQKVANDYKGIVIKNGKKVINK